MQVEQRHREAAADLVLGGEAGLWLQSNADDIRSGALDNLDVVQTFARFEASLPPSAPVEASALATELQRHIDAFHDGVPQGQGETGDGGTAGKALCQWVYDNAEAICAALTPSVLAESTSNDCLLVAEGWQEEAGELRKLAHANLATMEEEVRRCDRWDKSHAELDAAIVETRAALSRTPAVTDLSGVGVG